MERSDVVDLVGREVQVLQRSASEEVSSVQRVEIVVTEVNCFDASWPLLWHFVDFVVLKRNLRDTLHSTQVRGKIL